MDYVGRGGGCDPERTFMPAGQGAGFTNVRPTSEILRAIIADAERIVAEKFVATGPAAAAAEAAGGS
jgi:hypothetical protein